MNGFGSTVLRSEARPYRPPPKRESDLARRAEMLIRQMRSRTSFLPQVAYEDPQWLMILHLFIAAETGRKLCVSDLCSVSEVPSSTALRHIARLEQHDVIVRAPHPKDGRMSYIALDDEAHDQIAAYLRSLPSG